MSRCSTLRIPRNVSIDVLSRSRSCSTSGPPCVQCPSEICHRSRYTWDVILSHWHSPKLYLRAPSRQPSAAPLCIFHAVLRLYVVDTQSIAGVFATGPPDEASLVILPPQSLLQVQLRRALSILARNLRLQDNWCAHTQIPQRRRFKFGRPHQATHTHKITKTTVQITTLSIPTSSTLVTGLCFRIVDVQM